MALVHVLLVISVEEFCQAEPRLKHPPILTESSTMNFLKCRQNPWT